MPVLKYDLRVTGEQAVTAALASIERRVAAVNRAAGLRGGSGLGAGVGAVPTPRRAGGATARTDQFGRNLVREARARQDEWRASLRAANDEHRVRMRNIREQVRTRRAARRAAEREEARVARQREADLRRQSAIMQRQRAAYASGMLGTAGRSAGRAIAGVGRGAAMVAGIGGAALVATSVQQQVNIERQAAMLANKAYGTPGETRSRRQIRDSVMRQARSVGTTTGDRAGFIESLDKFVAISGKLEQGQKLGGFMADISDATGAQASDVGRTAGQVFQALSAQNMSDDEAFRQTKEILAAMAGQAKVGSIEFADLATQMGKLISSTVRFEGEAADLANTMGAMGQLAIAGGASSPEEAMTSLKRFSDDLVQNAHRYDKIMRGRGSAGVFADEGKTRLRNPVEIMLEMLQQTGGDLTQAKKVFGIRSMKAFEPLQQAYVKAEKNQQGSGVEAVRGMLDRFQSAGMSTSEIATSAAFTRQQTGREVQVAWDDLKAALGEEMLPVIREITPQLKEWIPALVKAGETLTAFVRGITNDPVSGIGSIIAGKVGMDVAGAGIGASIQASIMKSAMGGAGGAGGPMPVNVANAGALGGAIGLAVAAAIYNKGKTEIHASEGRINKAGKELNRIRQGGNGAGKFIAETREQARQAQSKADAAPSTLQLLSGMGGGLLGADAWSKKGQYQAEAASLNAMADEAAQRKAVTSELNNFIAELGAAATVTDRFSSQLGALANRPNRGNSPSPVK